LSGPTPPQLPGDLTLTVTTAESQRVAIISGLGFISMTANGGHHRMLLVMMAKGEM
jgi:hypothetical protein